MAWDFETEPEFQDQLDWIDTFVRERIWPLEPELEELGLEQVDEALRPLITAVKEAGLWAPHLPPQQGGMGFGQLKLGLIHEILGTSPFGPVAFGCAPPDSGNSELLAVAGTDAQKARYLEPLIAGEARSAFSMTEPDNAGSDPTEMTTTATWDGDGFVIEGRKWFTTNGSIADFLIVMAVTDPDADPHRRASMFVIPADTPGVVVERDVPTLEDPAGRFGRLDGHAEIAYDGVRVDGSALLGERGAGFALAQTRLGPGRIHHCMRWLGVCNRAFEMLCERASYRVSGGKPLGEHQAVQIWIADSAAEIQAARLMTLQAAWKIDCAGAKAAALEIGLIKFFGAKVLHDVIDRAVQVHGALGLSTDLPLERMYRFARSARIYDGPDEVHRQAVARRLMRGVEPPPGHVPSQLHARQP